MCTAYEIDGANYDVDFLVADAFEGMMAEADLYQIIRPTLMAPVIMPDRSVRMMSWGFRYTPRGQSKPRTVVNSREDQLGIRLWKEHFEQRRCLIPATAFFEWVSGPGGSVPLRFTRPGRKRILIAGIWGVEEGRGECFSMITTEPTAAIGPVHDRMPAVLAFEQLQPHLTGELKSYGPSSVLLEWKETENFLKGRKRAIKDSEPKPTPKPKRNQDPPEQGQLFS